MTPEALHALASILERDYGHAGYRFERVMHPFVLSPSGIRHRSAPADFTQCGIPHDVRDPFGIWWWLLDAEPYPAPDCKRCFRDSASPSSASLDSQ